MKAVRSNEDQDDSIDWASLIGQSEGPWNLGLDTEPRST